MFVLVHTEWSYGVMVIKYNFGIIKKTVVVGICLTIIRRERRGP